MCKIKSIVALLQLLILINLRTAIAAPTSEIKWEKLAGLDLSQLDPVGYSNYLKKYYYLGRHPNDNGYLIGMYHTGPNQLYSTDEKLKSHIIKDDGKIEILKYPPGSLTWEFVTTVLGFERIRPYLVPAGKDQAGEDVYYCRFVHSGRLMIGTYVASRKPVECVQTWSNGRIVKSNVFEMLVLSQMGETLGVELPKTE